MDNNKYVANFMEQSILNNITGCNWKKCEFEEKPSHRVTFSNVIPSNGAGDGNLLVFIFILIDMDDNNRHKTMLYCLKYDELIVQCEEQGYMEMNYNSLWDMIQQQSHNCQYGDILNNLSDETLQFILSLSNQLKLNIELRRIYVHHKCLERLYQDLIKQIGVSSLIQLNKIRKQQDIINGKDAVIEFLKENLINLGGISLINKWAPKGSLNYEFLEKNDMSNLKSNVEKSLLQDDIEDLMNGYLKWRQSDQLSSSSKRSHVSIIKDSNKDTTTQNKQVKRSFGRVKVNRE